MTFFGSTANDACFNAWIIDVTEEKHRGAVEGVNSMMPLVAILVVFGGFMSFNLDSSASWTWIFIIIGVLVFIVGLLSMFLIKEPITQTNGNENFFKNLIYSFKPSTVKANPILYITIIAFAIFGISIQVFMPYLIIYYDVSLAMDNYVLIMAPAIIIASVITAIYGRYFDKVGFLPSILPSLGCLALGYVLLILFTNVALVFIGSLFMMTGYLTGMAVFGAMIRNHTPQSKAGAFQGIRIIGQVLIPGVIGPIIGAWVLKNAETYVNPDDGITSFIPNQNIFIAALVIALITIGLCFLVNLVVKKIKSKAKLEQSA